MRSEIHAAVPLWINTPLEPPLPSGSPVTERWRLVQKHLPPLAELLDVEIVIMNAEGYCVGGTGPYLRGVGFRMPADNALTYSLRSGQSSMVLTPGKEEVCRTCSGKGACADVANFTGPVVIENEIVAVVQIVAFTDNQRAELLMKSERRSSSSARSSVSHGPADATWNRSPNNRAMTVFPASSARARPSCGSRRLS